MLWLKALRHHILLTHVIGISWHTKSSPQERLTLGSLRDSLLNRSNLHTAKDSLESAEGPLSWGINPPSGGGVGGGEFFFEKNAKIQFCL